MKKILSLIGAAFITFGMTSCETLQKIAQDENFGKLVTAIASNYVNAQGTTYNYTGTAQAQLLKKTADGYLFVEKDGKTTKVDMTLPLVAGNVATIQFPTISVDGGTMTNTAVGNLVITANGSKNTVTVGDQTTATGSLTLDGKTYNISGVYLQDCTYSTTKFEGKTMQIYFGDANDYVMSITFDGKVQ